MVSCQRAWTLAYVSVSMSVSVSVSVREREDPCYLRKKKVLPIALGSIYGCGQNCASDPQSFLYLLLGIGARQRDKLNV